MKNWGEIQFLMVKITGDNNDNYPLEFVHSSQWQVRVLCISSVSTTRPRTWSSVFFKYSICKDHWGAWRGYWRTFWRVNSWLSYLLRQRKNTYEVLAASVQFLACFSFYFHSVCATLNWEVWFDQGQILQTLRLCKAYPRCASRVHLLYQDLWLPILQRGQTPVLAQSTHRQLGLVAFAQPD